MKSNSSLFDVENLSVSTRSVLALDGFLLIKKKKNVENLVGEKHGLLRARRIFK